MPTRDSAPTWSGRGRSAGWGEIVPAGCRPTADGSVLGRLELQRQRVHAVAQTGGRRTVGEHVAEVAATAGAGDLGPAHAERRVVVLVDRAVDEGPGEAGPARSGLELCVDGEQVGPAPCAGEHAAPLDVEQRSGPGRLGALLTQHGVALRREPGAPLLVGQLDLGAAGGGLVGGAHCSSSVTSWASIRPGSRRGRRRSLWSTPNGPTVFPKSSRPCVGTPNNRKPVPPGRSDHWSGPWAESAPIRRMRREIGAAAEG